MESKITLLYYLLMIFCCCCNSLKVMPNTRCLNIFYIDDKGIGAMEKNLLSLCNKIISSTKIETEQAPSEGEGEEEGGGGGGGDPGGRLRRIEDSGDSCQKGCLECKLRTINGQYEFVSKLSISGICLGPSSSWNDSKTGVMDDDYAKGLFDAIKEQINTQEGFNKNLQTQLVFKEAIEEFEKQIEDITIEITEVLHTKDAYAYDITNKNNFPVKCYKAMGLKSEGDIKFKKGDLYFILKPKEAKKRLTEYFPTSNYDCNKYYLYFNCSTIPLQENIKLTTQFYTGEIDHSSGSTCEYKENGIITPNAPSIEGIISAPILDNDNPKKDFKNDLEESLKNGALSALDELKTFLDPEKGDADMITKANQYIYSIDCGEGESRDELCVTAKTEVLAKSTEIFSKIVTKSDSFIDSVKNDKTNSLNPEEMVLLTLINIAEIGNIVEYLDEYSSKTMLNITTKVLSQSKEIMDFISEQNDAYENDVFNYLCTVVMSSYLFIKQDTEANTITTKENTLKEYYNALKVMGKLLIAKDTTLEDEEIGLGFTFSKKKEVERILLDVNESQGNEGDKGLDNGGIEINENIIDPKVEIIYFFNNELKITIPRDAIFEKYGNKNPLGVSVYSFKTYPFFSELGLQYFLGESVSVFLSSNFDDEKNEIEVSELENPLELMYRIKDDAPINIKKCYHFNSDMEKPKEIDSEIKLDEEGKYIVCRIHYMGDILIGDFESDRNGLHPAALFYIIMACVNVVAWLLFTLYYYFHFVVKKKKKKKEDQENKGYKVNSKPSSSNEEQIEIIPKPRNNGQTQKETVIFSSWKTKS